MAELAHGTQPEFWRPPSPRAEEDTKLDMATSMAEACPRCGTEYLLGSHFCHSCGGRRPEAASASAKEDAASVARFWREAVHLVHATASSVALDRIKFPDWLRYLSFHEIKSRIGLSTASLISFLVGLGCIAGALLVGFLTAKTLAEWQAIQFYRVEWLLGATAAFVAGILLKKETPRSND